MGVAEGWRVGRNGELMFNRFQFEKRKSSGGGWW